MSLSRTVSNILVKAEEEGSDGKKRKRQIGRRIDFNLFKPFNL